MAARPASMEPKAVARSAIMIRVNAQHESRPLILSHAPESQPDSRVMGEQPEKSNDGNADPYEQQAVDVDRNAPQGHTSRNEDGQSVGHALEPAPAQTLQDGQADGIRGDDLRNGHTPHPDQHEPVDQGSKDARDENGDERAEKIAQTHGFQEGPGDESCNHVNGAVGKVGDPANAVDKGKTQGHQGQGNAVDGAVDQDLHEPCPDELEDQRDSEGGRKAPPCFFTSSSTVVV